MESDGSMGMSSIFGWLSQELEHYESDRVEIKRVEAVQPDKPELDGDLSVTIELAISLFATISGETADDTSPTTATIREDGGLQVDFSPSALPIANWQDDERVSVEKGMEVCVEDETILVTSTVTISDDDQMETSQIPIDNNTSRQKENRIEPNQRTDVVEGSTDESNDSTRLESAPASVSVEQTTRESEVSLARNENLPPYEDTEYLQQIYDSCETFIEMTEVFDMDVSTETVRRYMTEAGVHEPSSYNTMSTPEPERAASSEQDEVDSSYTVDEEDAESAENNPEQATVHYDDHEISSGVESETDDPVEGVKNQQLVADGIGLPDGVTIKQLADAVESSITVHEVRRELNIEQNEARELLKRLNLLDLVLTRVGKLDNRSVSRTEIADRIRQSVTSSS